MRYINIEDKIPSDEWIQKSQQLTSQLTTLQTMEERKEFINNHSYIWGEIKEWLEGVSHGKCWYSEAREKYSFLHIDHFRPKKAAKELDGTKREGYWWLAFDWKNFRICGSIGNVQHHNGDELMGKGEFFPLRAGTQPATGPDCDLRDEIYYFLDPTDINDPGLIMFDESGIPKPTAPEGTWENERARITIKLLHLDYEPLIEGRKEKWNECFALMKDLELLYSEFNTTSSITIKSKITECYRKLRDMVSEEAELSSTIRDCIQSSGNELIKRIIKS